MIFFWKSWIFFQRIQKKKQIHLQYKYAQCSIFERISKNNFFQNSIFSLYSLHAYHILWKSYETQYRDIIREYVQHM